ncbi:MAG: cob(I)yrinic acid a,c-diamide adenosyltransferase [Planctomycetales bacterium]|nr:cob(I)yrinic acid a,c-diamide adenosyltransferase [Planctomycetales bacterium]
MVHLSKIVTKTGDDGTTGLGDGSRVPKTDPRVEATGTVDEASSVLGLAIGAIADPAVAELLRGIQNDLFDVGADLCSPPAEGEEPGKRLRVAPAQVETLEKAVESWNARLKPLGTFVLPGGTPAAAWLHLARTVVRRAERLGWAAAAKHPVSRTALVYLNRLSDLLFILSRVANDDGARDVLWEPGKGQGGPVATRKRRTPETRRHEP